MSSKKTFILVTVVLAAIGITIMSFKERPAVHTKVMSSPKDSVGSVSAFMGVYRVLMSARCMNCHPSGNVPLQGDDSHLHTMGVKRGSDGKGLYAMKCSNCHQAENAPGLHAPPGNPKWGLPPANMRMVFQGRTPRQLALQILDPKQNGGRSKQQIIDHMTSDDLVSWAWRPGDGRTLPPLSHAAFSAQVKLWIAKGAYAPAK
jgi:mono/diheme cytochrome c family protein